MPLRAAQAVREITLPFAFRTPNPQLCVTGHHLVTEKLSYIRLSLTRASAPSLGPAANQLVDLELSIGVINIELLNSLAVSAGEHKSSELGDPLL